MPLHTNKGICKYVIKQLSTRFGGKNFRFSVCNCLIRLVQLHKGIILKMNYNVKILAAEDCPKLVRLNWIAAPMDIIFLVSYNRFTPSLIK